MRQAFLTSLLFASLILSGCATQTSVMLTQASPTKKIQTAALVPDHRNTPGMDSHIQGSLAAHGISMKKQLPIGTKKSTDVDAIVSYSDEWLWDIAMYLNSVTINLFDAATGNLLVTGQWHESPVHGFHDSQTVVKELIAEMLTKLSIAKKN